MNTNQTYARLFLGVVALCLGIANLNAASPENSAEQYSIEAFILNVPSNSSFVASITNTPCISKEDIYKQLVISPVVKCISAPTIGAAVNQEAMITVGLGSKLQLQYFEPQTNGLFALRTIPGEATVGFRLRTTVMPTTKGYAKLEMDFRYTFLQSRNKIPNVSLDVGYPIIATSTSKTNMAVHLGEWVVVNDQLLSDVENEKLDHLVVLARVSLVDARGDKLSTSIQSDRMQINHSNRTITADGNVTVKASDGTTIKADKAEIALPKK
jgi:hypothetical protein